MEYYLGFTMMACYATGLSISTLLVTLRMRRRMKSSLRRQISGLDLVSYKMWNLVEDEEQLNPGSKPIHPR
jgi:hypothetical protein